MVRDGFPDLFAGLPEEADARALAARTYEFSEFLVDVLGVEELPVARRGTATLHHSCHTRRLLGVVEQPERLLGMIDGLEYVPLPGAEQCCGFGGTFAVKMPHISTAMVDEKVDHILETGADLVVGLDASCLMNIEGPAAAAWQPARGAPPRGSAGGGVAAMTPRSPRAASEGRRR